MAMKSSGASGSIDDDNVDGDADADVYFDLQPSAVVLSGEVGGVR